SARAAAAADPRAAVGVRGVFAGFGGVRDAGPTDPGEGMKFLCGSCERLVPVEVFRVAGAAVVLTCPRCGVENRSGADGASPAQASTARAAQSAQSADPFAAPPDRCPKCIAPRPPDAAS